MQFDDLFDRWGPNDIWLKGHRISLEDVVDLFEAGWSLERIAEYFPSLEAEHIANVIAYYQQHHNELDDYLEAQRRYAEASTREAELHPSPHAQRMRALLEARRRAGTTQTTSAS